MNKQIIDFIYESGGIGIEFYNPAEYQEFGTYYTIIDTEDDLFILEWWEPRLGTIERDSMGWDYFKGCLVDGFFVVKNLKFVLDAMTLGYNLDSDEIFGDLNEGFNYHKPKLDLRFDPPIYNIEELRNVMRTIEMVYPQAKWKSGNKPTDIPDGVNQVFDDEYDNEVIYYITIGYHKISPYGITYTACYDGDPYICDDDHDRFDKQDGWDWYREHRFDADETSAMFDDLNESEDDFDWAEELIDTPIKGPVPGQVYRVTVDDEGEVNGIIDVLITKVELNSVYDNARAVVTNPTSVSPEDINEFIEDYDKNDGFTTKSHAEYLIDSGHWVLISYNKSLFSIKDFDPYYYTDRGLDL